MIKKELHFGAAEITVSKSGKKVLTIDEHIGFSIMQVIVSDAEILEDDNSPEVILMEITGRKKPIELLIHKKDCLKFSQFLLEIYGQYAERINEIELEEYQNRLEVDKPV